MPKSKDKGVVKRVIVTPDKHFPLADIPAINCLKRTIEIITPDAYVDLGDVGEWSACSHWQWSKKKRPPLEYQLPFIDKENTLRIEQEPLFGRSKLNPAHGNHMVKDIEKKELFKQAISPIMKELIEFLGEKGYNIYLFNELINYFNPSINLAISIGNEEKRSFNYMGQRFEGEGQDQQEIQTFDKTVVQVDMFGQPFDSVERREFKLNTSNNNGSNSFELYTIKGQLGSGIDVEPEPMEGCSED